MKIIVDSAFIECNVHSTQNDMSKTNKHLAQLIRVDEDASTCIDEIRQPLGNPDKRTLASAMIRWATSRVKAKELSFVNGALVPSANIKAA